MWMRTITAAGVRVSAVFRWGYFPGKDFAHADWLEHLCGQFGELF